MSPTSGWLAAGPAAAPGVRAPDLRHTVCQQRHAYPAPTNKQLMATQGPERKDHSQFFDLNYRSIHSPAATDPHRTRVQSEFLAAGIARNPTRNRSEMPLPRVQSSVSAIRGLLNSEVDGGDVGYVLAGCSDGDCIALCDGLRRWSSAAASDHRAAAKERQQDGQNYPPS